MSGKYDKQQLSRWMLRIAALVLFLFAVSSWRYSGLFAQYVSSASGSSTAHAAVFNVKTMDENGDPIGRTAVDLDVTAGSSSASYTFQVQSQSEVSIQYDVQLTGVPNGVTVTLDGNKADAVSSTTVTFQDAGQFAAADKTAKTHTLRFTASDSADTGSTSDIAVTVIAAQTN